MDAAIAYKTEQVELTRASAFYGFEKPRLERKLAGGDELIDARAVHVDDAASADIQVADFAIAHLSDGKANGGAGSSNQGVGKIPEDAVVVGLARESDRVAVGFGPIAPAIENGKDNGFWAFDHGRF